jgi:hypothetical protein
MDIRLTGFEDDFNGGDEEAGEPQAIDEILAELFTQYQARFPGVEITVYEVPATA